MCSNINKTISEDSKAGGQEGAEGGTQPQGLCAQKQTPTRCLLRSPRSPRSQACEGVASVPGAEPWRGFWRSGACERRVAGCGDGHHVWMDRGEDDPSSAPLEARGWGNVGVEGTLVVPEQRASPASCSPLRLRAIAEPRLPGPGASLSQRCPSSSEPGTAPMLPSTALREATSIGNYHHSRYHGGSVLFVQKQRERASEP